jgi:prepilin-type N-terminal cleavage/methylation domain-containing protein
MLKAHGPVRRGFTLIEVVVAAAIMAALAAVTIPQVLDALDKKRVQDTYDLLLELHTGITNSNQTGFMNVVRSGAATTTSYAPGRLSHLSEPIVASSITNFHNSCGFTAVATLTASFSYNATAVTAWNTGGPFIRRVIQISTSLTQDGIRTPIGQLQNTLVRTPVTAWPLVTTTAHAIQLRINSVDPKDAAALDSLVDGSSSPTAGSLRYSTASGVSTVNYLIPVPSRC